MNNVVAIIMTLFMFIFSCFAMNTFGNIKPGELLTTDANFGTFFLSFNTMWRLSSGESYNGLMHDLNIHPPYCNPRQGGTINPNDGNCGNEFFSFFIMVMSFTTLNYILVNLFIAIILDNFSLHFLVKLTTVSIGIKKYPLGKSAPQIIEKIS